MTLIENVTYEQAIAASKLWRKLGQHGIAENIESYADMMLQQDSHDEETRHEENV